MKQIIKNICNILSLSGGGSLGISEISILEEVYGGEKYDLITGISVGSLNAFYLSHFENFEEGINSMKDIWFDLKSKDIYEFSVFNPYEYWSIYDTKPLWDTFGNILKDLPQGDKTRTIVGSTNLNENKLEIFDIHTFDDEMQKMLLLASSAIPIAFPPIHINDTYYVDGGFITNEILFEVDKFMKCDEYNITVILTDNPNDNFQYINNIEDYIDVLIKGMLKNFDLQLLKFKSIFKNSNIIIHYIDKPKNITMLNFDNSKYVYKYSKNFFTKIV